MYTYSGSQINADRRQWERKENKDIILEERMLHYVVADRGIDSFAFCHSLNSVSCMPGTVLERTDGPLMGEAEFPKETTTVRQANK